MASSIRALARAIGRIQKQLAAGLGVAPLFGYSDGQSITVDTETAITGLSLAVEEDVFYFAELYIKCDDAAASSGNIATQNSAVFETLGLTLTRDGASPTLVTDFEYAALAAGELLIISGVIKVTTAGNISITGATVNAPDAFVIAPNATLTLTRIGAA